jgi:hypothetical protein
LPPNLRHKSLSKFQPGQLDKLTGLLFDASMQPLQLVLPLKYAMAAGGLCCVGTLGVLLQASENHGPDDPVASLIARPIRTVRVIPDDPPAPPTIISPVPFEERWQTTTQSAALRPVPATTTEPPAQAAKIIRTARAEPSDDPVCGDKGRRYFYIGRHKYWKCRR